MTALDTADARTGQRLLQLGMLLFLLGLATGFALPAMANPRMGLSSHLEGVMNGMFLLALGLIWARLNLGSGARKLVFAFAVYGTFTNWMATLLAGFWGAGAPMMPIAAGGYTGTEVQEALIAFALLSLSVSMLVVSVLSIWGLRMPAAQGAAIAEGRAPA